MKPELIDGIAHVRIQAETDEAQLEKFGYSPVTFSYCSHEAWMLDRAVKDFQRTRTPFILVIFRDGTQLWRGRGPLNNSTLTQ